MKKSGITLLIVGSLVALEALIRGNGTITIGTTVFSLTLINIAYLLYTSGKNTEEKVLKFEDILEQRKIVPNEEDSVEELDTVFEQREERDFDFVELINKFSNIRIESILENTTDLYKKRELQKVLKQRRSLI